MWFFFILFYLFFFFLVVLQEQTEGLVVQSVVSCSSSTCNKTYRVEGGNYGHEGREASEYVCNTLNFFFLALLLFTAKCAWVNDQISNSIGVRRQTDRPEKGRKGGGVGG